ncbi:TetR/AcrR family transcriptional regulator [Methylovirgula sp. 4M-Z18]|uniref:TetR/AcrR family transcriptional regulator n=1 Tax=Methylovirgula sp. 4M-Z18 TaxID=2293567 RepID=UPI0013148780|nr:TetR/AcrR family transcriptional regulator [Methylovirgula sp. 4M-Z18]
MNTFEQTTKPTTPYHHGDLRRALLDSASAILSETGRWDFSLREVAKRAGVSHNAPYRHFADKEALLAAVGVAGFEALRARTTAAAKETSDAVEALKALGQAYVDFGASNPALYRLMFGQAVPNIDGRSPDIVEAANANRAVVRNVILAGARTGQFAVDPDDADDVTTTVVAAGSLVHGFTLLIIDGLIERMVKREAVEGLAMKVFVRFIAGLTPKHGKST